MTKKDTNNKEPKKQTLIGTVAKKSGDKTVSVLIERYVKHPKYKKFYQSRKLYAAHDEENQAQVNDRVVIENTRPISKTKKFRVIDIKSTN